MSQLPLTQIRRVIQNPINAQELSLIISMDNENQIPPKHLTKINSDVSITEIQKCINQHSKTYFIKNADP